MDNNTIFEYVTTNIDKAIAKGWITVYYQPVIRSITGQLCGVESLARWIDPEIGFIGPDKFINALEEKKLIHKLDSFIVDKVCSDIHDQLIKSLPAVPASVNMSRLDFIMCDMLRVLEDSIEKYNIPRDYIHIEITESMIVQDESLMIDIINKFRSRGYEIWMDDFGSGYSSLTLLKDYEFDLLKMDMRFLSSMNDKSKTLMQYTIGMAKKIGIKTLCEGVETLEQVEFLKSIGCGKLQGYYYSKPLPVEELIKVITQKGISFEERKWKNYYEAASITVHQTDAPLAVVEYKNGTFKTLFVNDSFRQQIGIKTKDLKLIDSTIYNTHLPIIKKYISFAQKVATSRSQESFYYTSNGNYFQLKMGFIAENEGNYLFKASINNISHDENTIEKDKLDFRLRELNNLYEDVLLINYKEEIILPLIRNTIYMNELPLLEMNVHDVIMHFTQNYVYQDDRKDYLTFMCFENEASLKKISSQEFIKSCIRIKQKDGSYEWREISLLAIPGTEGNEFLFIVGKVSFDVLNALDSIGYQHFSNSEENSPPMQKEYSIIWDNIIRNSTYKLFWKDKERRFRGVSKAFLEFYEIDSPDDIIGKNDEEMHWHVDDGPYQGDELDVLYKGKIIYNAHGQCIVNGVVHDIICNKLPIYENGKIVGLVGTFDDIDQELFRIRKLANPSRTDKITRLMNSKSFLEVMFDYSLQYNDEGKNYGYIVLHNVNHQRLLNTFGNKFSAKVLREIGERIIDIVGQGGVAARVKEAYFCVMLYEDSKEKLKEFATKLKKHIEEICSIDGKAVTLKITTVYHLRSDEGITDESLHMISINEIDAIEAKLNR